MFHFPSQTPKDFMQQYFTFFHLLDNLPSDLLSQNVSLVFLGLLAISLPFMTENLQISVY
jgi:hypothetical protein